MERKGRVCWGRTAQGTLVGGDGQLVLDGAVHCDPTGRLLGGTSQWQKTARYRRTDKTVPW